MKLRARRSAVIAALALSVCALPVSADPPASFAPTPVCLPPRGDSCVPHSKRDRQARYRPPRLMPMLATLVNLHTHEAAVLEPTPGRDEAATFARLFRDRTNWNEHEIAPACIETIRRACVTLSGRRVEVISGYRSDKMNETLRKKGRHVAQRSQHVLGNAVDFRLADVPMPLLMRFVRQRHVGGVGFYRDSSFVHVDAGRPRFWRGE